MFEGIERIKNLSDFSIENGLRLLVDAEYTYMNDGISLMALGMMCHYNKSKAYVGNTYQCYLKVGLIITATVKPGNKERFDKEQIGTKEPFPVTNLPFSS